jgi:hypothetical protein
VCIQVKHALYSSTYSMSQTATCVYTLKAVVAGTGTYMQNFAHLCTRFVTQSSICQEMSTVRRNYNVSDT